MNRASPFRERDSTRKQSLAERVYAALKQMIFDFELLPGDYFSEAEVAERTGASRTPVREALHRLRREGYVEVHFRSGWQVVPFDFEVFEQLYDVRIVLECAAIGRLCAMSEQPATLQALRDIWCVPIGERSFAAAMAEQDKAFHTALVTASGNQEMARIHRDVSERIHIIRRLDFTQASRIEATYDEHAAILEALARRREAHACQLLSAHIALSRNEVRKITLHMLHEARSRHAQGPPET